MENLDSMDVPDVTGLLRTAENEVDISGNDFDSLIDFEVVESEQELFGDHTISLDEFSQCFERQLYEDSNLVTGASASKKPKTSVFWKNVTPSPVVDVPCSIDSEMRCEINSSWNALFISSCSYRSACAMPKFPWESGFASKVLSKSNETVWEKRAFFECAAAPNSFRFVRTHQSWIKCFSHA